MWPGRALRWPTIEPAVNGVELRTQLATHVEPPVAHEHRLAELRAVWAQEARLSAVNVAVVPSLASRLDVRKKSRIRLLVAVEVGVGHLAEHRIIRTRSSWKTITF